MSKLPDKKRHLKIFLTKFGPKIQFHDRREELTNKMINLNVLKQSSIIQLFFAISYFSSGIILCMVQAILYFGLKPFNKTLYRKINYYLSYSFYSQLVFMSEWWSGTTMSIYVKKDEYDKLYGKEHGYLIMNHSYEIDWLMGWQFCDGIQVLGNCKAYAKNLFNIYHLLVGCGNFLSLCFWKDHLIKTRK